MEVVPLAPTKTSSNNDAVNVKGSNDDEGNIVQQESNETAKDTVNTSEAMDTEHAVQGCKRQISDSDSDGKLSIDGQESTLSQIWVLVSKEIRMLLHLLLKRPIPIMFHDGKFVFLPFFSDSINNYSG